MTDMTNYHTSDHNLQSRIDSLEALRREYQHDMDKADQKLRTVELIASHDEDYSLESAKVWRVVLTKYKDRLYADILRINNQLYELRKNS